MHIDGHTHSDGDTHIDCDTCEVRGAACGDCVVTVLLGSPPEGVRLDDDEREALEVLAASGLVPPLRLVPRSASRDVAHDSPGPRGGPKVPIFPSTGLEGQERRMGRPQTAG